MFGISFWELLVIAGIALLVMGPKQAAEFMYFLGKTIGMLSRKWKHFVREINHFANQEDDTD